MSDLWPYLDSPVFAMRYGMVAAYLKQKSVRIVLDLNCGRTAPLYSFLMKEPFYIGNDIRLENQLMAPTGLILKVPDHEMLEVLQRRDLNPDAVLLLGCGAGKHTGEEVESRTDMESFRAIVGYSIPRIAILESVVRFEDRYSILSNQLSFFAQLGYHGPEKIFTALGPYEADTAFVNARLMWIFEKED